MLYFSIEPRIRLRLRQTSIVSHLTNKIVYIVSDCTESSGGVIRGITTVSVAVRGIEARPVITTKRVRPKPASPNRQGPQQCQVSLSSFNICLGIYIIFVALFVVLFVASFVKLFLLTFKASKSNFN